MSDWLSFGGYVVGFALTYRMAYPVMADQLIGASDGVERGLAAAMTLLGCLMWPVILVGLVAWRVLTPTTPKQREQEIAERERHIEQLECELGIGPENKPRGRGPA